MFGSIFLKECRQILKSILYYAFVAVILLDFVTQYGNVAQEDVRGAESAAFGGIYDPGNPLMQPPENAASYGARPAEIPEQVVPNAISSLYREYFENRYASYPLGIIKYARLSETEQQRIREIIQECTGLTPEEISQRSEELYQEYFDANGYINLNDLEYSRVIPQVIDYPAFRERMAEVSEMIGKGSNYEPDELKQYGSAPYTYEEKRTEWDYLMNTEQITGSYARLYCDYMGIFIILFGVFVPVSFLLRDQRGRVSELLYSRRVPSAVLLGARYCAVAFMMLLPVLLLSFVPLVPLLRFGASQGIAVDGLGFIKYIFAWTLPSVLIVCSVGFFLTVLTDTPIAIIVQFLWSYISILSSGLSGGDYGLTLTIRHNTLKSLQAVQANLSAIVFNRVFYTAAALLLLGATVLIYEKKRRGLLDVGGALRKIFRNRKAAAPATGVR